MEYLLVNLEPIGLVMLAISGSLFATALGLYFTIRAILTG